MSGAFFSFAMESLSYSGRLVQPNGAPVAGPVNLKADLVYTNNVSAVLCSDDISSVALSKGVFYLKLDFTCAGGKTLTEVLSQTPAGESVAIQITDVTNSKSYSYQAIHALPFANVASQLVQMAATRCWPRGELVLELQLQLINCNFLPTLQQNQEQAHGQ